MSTTITTAATTTTMDGNKLLKSKDIAELYTSPPPLLMLIKLFVFEEIRKILIFDLHYLAKQSSSKLSLKQFDVFV